MPALKGGIPRGTKIIEIGGHRAANGGGAGGWKITSPGRKSHDFRDFGSGNRERMR